MYKYHRRMIDCVSILPQVPVCLHASIKDNKQQPCALKDAPTVAGILFAGSTVKLRDCAVVGKAKHLRLVCNVLWKMHNFCAFKSE